MQYHFKIHREKEGFWAECIELLGCMTQADTKEELNANMQEALNLYLEEAEDCEYLAPSPRASIKLDRNVVAVPVDPSIVDKLKKRKS